MEKDFVFDIDGTLANGDHRLHHLEKKPKAWDAYFAADHLDEPHDDIVWLAREFFCGAHRIVICTARPDRLREQTVEWLKKNEIPFDLLYMRVDGDRRPGPIVKVEMLHQMRNEGVVPFMWFEDDPEVTKALRANGVRVLHVQEGKIL